MKSQVLFATFVTWAMMSCQVSAGTLPTSFLPATVIADKTGDNDHTDPDHFGIAFESGGPGSFIQSLTYDMSSGGGAGKFDFDGGANFMNATGPVIHQPSLDGLRINDITHSFTGQGGPVLTFTFAPRSFGVGDSFRWAADTDGGSEGPGRGFGIHGVSASIVLENGLDGAGVFEVVGDISSVATVRIVPEPTAVTLAALGLIGCAAHWRRRRRKCDTRPARPSLEPAYFTKTSLSQHPWKIALSCGMMV